MKWYSNEKSIINPEYFAPKDLGFVKLGIIVFVERVYNWMKEKAHDIIMEKEEEIIGAKRFFATKEGLGVFHSYFGAPAATALTEALIAAGIRRLIVLGEAGSISPKVNVGEIIVPIFAIREEGTSYHYLPPEAMAEPSSNLLDRIRRLLESMGLPYKTGGVWTTDAPFRETMDKVLVYSGMGALAVEMECSAIFSVSRYRGADVAAILIITDTLYDGVWRLAFNEPKVIEIEKRISEILALHWGELIIT